MPMLRALAGAFDKASLFVCCALVTALLGCVSLGALLLWLDFFITMAIFRRTVRSIDGRLRRIESSVGLRRE